MTQSSDNTHTSPLENSSNTQKRHSNGVLDVLDVAAHADDQRAYSQDEIQALRFAAARQNTDAHAVEHMPCVSIGAEVQEENLQQHSKTASGACALPPKAACSRWIEAAKEGDTRGLHRLLQQHPDLLNYQASGLRCTALHWTAARGHTDAMQQLLLWGADPCALTCTGCTPLFSAAGANQCECVELLVMLPLVQQQLEWHNEDGLTPAAYALKHGHHMVHGRLVQAAGARTANYHGNCTTHGPATITEKNSSMQLQQQQASMWGLRAGFFGPRPREQQLLATADAASTAAGHSTITGDDCTPHSHTAVSVDAAADGVVSSLLPLGNGISSIPEAAGQGSTAPTGEQRQQNLAHVPSTLANLKLCNASMAVDRAAVSTAETTQSAPAVAVHKQLGRAWLDAARAGDLQQLQAMRQAHPHILVYSGAGTSYAFTSNSAAHWAAAKGHAAVLQWLLQQGSLQGNSICALLNQAGATPLHTAAEHGQADCARLLVLCGNADVHQLDGLGQTAVHAAAATTATCGQQMVQQLLLWSLVQKLCSIDRSAWTVSTMQQLLRLAGKTCEAAACIEQHELLGLAQAVVDIETTACKLLQGQKAVQTGHQY